MIGADAFVAVFLETPGLIGVPSLSGLGNGIVDPEGQGVDGLDLLQNLEFSHFKPGVALLLGDECADGQFRSFTRTNLLAGALPTEDTSVVRVANVGQGVFRLDSAFGDVPGARIQQFNRSPQTATVAYEQNADMIVVAIPMDEIGLKPGDQFVIGAVVAGVNVRMNAGAPARALDTGYLGQSLTGSGFDAVKLEGVKVQLEADQDPDGDALITGDEVILGTDPNRADSDGDGLPDGWEVSHNLNPLDATGINGGEGDPDGDGLTNQEEFLMGTDPRDVRSALRLQVQALGNGKVRFAWPAVVGRSYRLQSAPALGQVFQDLQGVGFPRIATNAVEVFEDAVNGNQASFYRLRYDH